MPYYTDNRFDESRKAVYNETLPIGPQGRAARIWFRMVALPAYPGWHLVNMHCDWSESIECSSRDVLATIRDMRDAWRGELICRFNPEDI